MIDTKMVIPPKSHGFDVIGLRVIDPESLPVLWIEAETATHETTQRSSKRSLAAFVSSPSTVKRFD